MKSDKVVYFPDPNLRRVVGERVGKRPENITASALEVLEELDASFNHIADLTGLEWAVGLTKLDLKWNRIGDLTPLTHLKDLKHLDLSNNDIKNMGLLGSLTKLEKLQLEANNIEDISPLVELARLKKINLKNNRISQIGVLKKLPHLIEVNLSKNKIKSEEILPSLFECQPALIEAIVSQIPLYKGLEQHKQQAVVAYIHNPAKEEALKLLAETPVAAELVQNSLTESELERELGRILACPQTASQYVVEFIERTPFSSWDKVAFIEKWGSSQARETLEQVKITFLKRIKKSPIVVDEMPELAKRLEREIEQVMVEQFNKIDLPDEFIEAFMESKNMPLNKMNLIYQSGSKRAKLKAMEYQLAL
ncbi:hypothetical protein GGQ84_000054 [Desulfitispora alkaliphila]|uniref:leucine-rich repeat domain-containing protein n=1 Tax=Desulfitispora alkaliphila TaxID=622674 RepID=UPI003D1D0508